MLQTYFLHSFFGARPIPFHSVHQLEESTPNLIIWAAPVMFFFVLLEGLLSRKQNRRLYEKRDTIGSIAVGVGNVIINFFLKLSVFYLFILI